MSDILEVAVRRPGGKRDARRLRRAGRIPGILYGHGLPNVPLEALAEGVNAVIRHGSRVLDLSGALSEKVFLREVQWDPFGAHVLHFDLARVSADERVKVEVPVELRGEAPGLKQGGVVNQLVHRVEIECPVIAIPEKLTLRMGELAVGAHLLARQIEVPSGARLLTPDETVIVQCSIPKTEEEPGVPLAEGQEPELIGRKAEEEEESEEE
jgi:large subunit ribosomal protein L25